jgi:hypothetical protein
MEDLNDPVEMVRHDDEGVEIYIRPKIRRSPPFLFNDATGIVRIHSPAFNRAEETAPPPRSHRHKVESRKAVVVRLQPERIASIRWLPHGSNP